MVGRPTGHRYESVGARIRAAVALVPLTAILVAASCESAPYSEILDGKACSPSGECAATYECDHATNTCVPIGTANATSSSSSSTGTGGGPPGYCDDISDCPAPPNPCQTAVCLGHTCGTIAVNSGTVVPPASQVPGDCKIKVCDGLGSPQDLNADDDIPDDGHDCTEDMCISGVPTNRGTPLGTTCTENPGTLCDGKGQCVECIVASDCTMLPDDDECQIRTCNAGVCGQTFTTMGTAIAAQTDHDCKKKTCDGAGHVVTVADGLDLPDDGNDCTQNVCNGMTPSFVDVPSGDPCMAGLCNATGQCIGCLSPLNCSGTDDFCGQRTCDNGVCGHAYQPAGTMLPIAQQVDGDCQQAQCNGTGGQIVVIDDNDLPIEDMNECTLEACANGTPQHPPAALDAVCTLGGAYCDGSGTCVECNNATECSSTGSVCQDAACNTHMCGLKNRIVGAPADAGAQTPNDCKIVKCDGMGAPMLPSPDDADLPVDNNDCTSDVCSGGVPSNPPLGPGVTCGGGGQCNGMGMCANANKPNGDPCVANSECNSDACVDGYCCGNTCAGQCQGCSSAKTGNFNGVCSPIAAGQDPDLECMNADVCTVNGICEPSCGAAPTAPGGMCPAACTGGCSNGTCIINCNAASQCQGLMLLCPAGFACQVQCGGSSSCSNAIVSCPDKYACNVSCTGSCSNMTMQCGTGRCDLACGTNNVCSGAQVLCGSNECSATCNGSVAFPSVSCGSSCGCTSCQLDNGVPCANNGQCKSGNCPADDDVCCNNACNTACSACLGSKTGGADGTCGLVPNGQEPDMDCPGAATCNGSGGCALKPNGASCTAGSECSSGNCPTQDGVCCATACNGNCQSCLGSLTGGANGTCGNVLNNTDPNNDCPGMPTCNGSGQCTLGMNGAPCTSGGQCTSTFCPTQDKLCCESSCTANCYSCVGASTGGMDGQCLPVLANTDPNKDCPGNQNNCNGMGQCTN